MKTEEVLFKQPTGNYEGYVPTGIYEYEETPFTWDSCKVLLKLPRKITHFFDKGKILEARRTDFKDPLENYYLLKLIDGSFIEVEY